MIELLVAWSASTLCYLFFLSRLGKSIESRSPAEAFLSVGVVTSSSLWILVSFWTFTDLQSVRYGQWADEVGWRKLLVLCAILMVPTVICPLVACCLRVERPATPMSVLSIRISAGMILTILLFQLGAMWLLK
jgi:hypothetical protein